MQAIILDPLLQTHFFVVGLAAAIVISARRRTNLGLFDQGVTQELKGFAILAIIFAHVGYILASDQRFLFPISVFAGQGVDLFLLLSGFGLASSALNRNESIVSFYRRRLSKLYVPLWSVLLMLFVADWLFLGKTYSTIYVLRSFVGFFPSADAWSDVDSPLWYFLWIVFFYVVFPIVFSRRLPSVSAFALFASAVLITWFPLPISRSVIDLYQLHTLAFPLGVFAATIFRRHPMLFSRISRGYLAVVAIVALCIAIAYLAMNAYVGDWYVKAQLASMLAAALVTILFVIKRFEFKLLHIFGIFSFEIYLVHWPLLSRYDVFFKTLPGALALACFLIFTLGVAWILQRFLGRVRVLG